MHVPLRKKTLEIPSPTEKDWLKKDEEEDFFLKDPDKMFDSLPQPVRMVSKLVNLLLERAWEEIEGKHPLLQETKQQKLSTALYQPSDEFEIAGTANCIVASRIYIFMGISTGLSVFSMLTSEQLCAWEAARLEINTIQISDLADSSYLLGTVDELGVARLFIFYKENLLHVKAINEVEDITKRNACVALKLSHGSDYAGFLLQGSSEAWLEIYRLPKDSWLKETEHIQTVTTAPVVTQVPGTAKGSRISQMSLLEKKKSADVQGAAAEEVDLQQILSKVESKLIPPLLLLKLRSPKPMTASIFKNPFEALMKSEDSSVVGLGHNHMIKECQCERLEIVFHNAFQQYLETENELENKEEKPSHAVFHFLSSGRTLPVGIENKTDSGLPVAFSVHWSKSHNLCFYFLSRPPKEKADSDPKPDVVWPCAAPVVCSAVTPCSSFLAFACEDGIVTVWDRSLGFPLSVTALPLEYAIRSIQFMPCSVPPSEKMPCSSKHAAATKVKLLVLSAEGLLHLITSGPKECNTKLLGYRPEAPSQTISAVATIPTLPDSALIFFWNGIVNLMDTTIEDNICQFIIPPPYKVASPWQPVFSVDIDGQYLILRADDPAGSEVLFLFRFGSYSLTEMFAGQAEQPSDPLAGLSWDKRCDVFLNESLQQLSTVSQQIPECWSQLQEFAAALNRGESGEVNESAEPRADEEV